MDSMGIVIASWMAVWVAAVTSCCKVGKIADDAFSGDTKRQVSRWLSNAQPEHVLFGWANVFAFSFDAVFGIRHFSVKCFLRSAIASIVTVLIWDLLISRFIFCALFDAAVGGVGVDGSPPWLLVYFAPVNIVIDYLSLLETRFAVSLLQEQRQFIVRGLILAGDLLLTTVGAVAIGCILYYIADVPPLPFGLDLVVLPFILPFAYSTYLTSLWLWLFAVAKLANGALSWTGIGYGYAIRSLDTENKPFLAVGVICACLATVGIAISALVVVAYSFRGVS